MSSIIDNLKIVLGLETKGFPAGKKVVKDFAEGAQHSISGIRNTIAGLFTVHFAKEFVHKVSEMAERWKDFSEQTGMNTDQVQRFDAAFKKVGSSIDEVASAFDILIDKRQKALEEGGADESLFRKFGISEQELRSLDTAEKIFARIARGRTADNPEDRALFGEMFGVRRSGKMLAGAQSLDEGGGNVSIASKEDIKKMDDAAKAFEAAAREFKTAAIPLASALVNYIAVALKGYKFDRPNNAEERKQRLNEIWDLINPFSKKKKKLQLGTKPINPEARKLLGGFAGDVPEVHGHGEQDAEAVIYSRTLKKTQTAIQESLFHIFFKASNTGIQKRLLDAQIKKAQALVGEEKDPVERAKKQADVFKLAGERAEMERGGKFDFKSDSAASVGGFIGGAASIDPALVFQNDVRSYLAQILLSLEGLPPEFRDAVIEASKPPTVNSIGGGR